MYLLARLFEKIMNFVKSGSGKPNAEMLMCKKITAHALCMPNEQL